MSKSLKYFRVFVWIVFLAIVSLLLYPFYYFIQKSMQFSSVDNLADAIEENIYTEICLGDSYSVERSKTNSYYMLSIHNREIIIPNWNSNYADDGTWIIVGIAPNQKNVIYLVDKETILQYFNQTDENECKSLKQ